jgi:hypothetical protein
VTLSQLADAKHLVQHLASQLADAKHLASQLADANQVADAATELVSVSTEYSINEIPVSLVAGGDFLFVLPTHLQPPPES